MWRTQGRTFGRIEKLRIPRTALNVVGGESLASRRKMTTVEEVEDNLGMEKLDVWVVGYVVELGKEEEGTGRAGCRSKYWANEDQRDEPCKIREGRRDGFGQNS